MNRVKMKKQQGAALVVSLVFLLVMTVIGLSGMLDSNMQERMAGNQKRQIEAVMVAEAGIAHTASWLLEDDNWIALRDAWIADPDYDWGETDFGSLFRYIDGSEPTSPNFAGTNHAAYLIEITPRNSDEINIFSYGYVLDTGPGARSVLSRSQLATVFRYPSDGYPTGPEECREIIYGVGIISDREIIRRGNWDVTGSMHANQGIRVTGAGQTYLRLDGTAMAVGDVDATFQLTTQDENGNEVIIDPDSDVYAEVLAARVVPGSERFPVPLLTNEVMSNYLGGASGVIDPVAKSDGSHTLIQGKATYQIDKKKDNTTLNLSGDQNGAIYYVKGNVTIEGIFSNVTIVSEGNVNFKGSSSVGINSSGVDVAILAKGHRDPENPDHNNKIGDFGISFDGSNESQAVFVTNTSYNHDGSSNAIGSVIAGGNINWNGQGKFIHLDSDNSNLPCDPTDGDFVHWLQGPAKLEWSVAGGY